LSRLPGKRARPVLRGLGRSNAPRLPDWQPPFYLLEDDFECWLLDARSGLMASGAATDAFERFALRLVDAAKGD
jgi:hypothetical protein